MDKDYTIERLWKELDEGYQINYTYMEKRYVLTKLQKNCYSNELITVNEKNPHPKTQIITLKAIKELHPFMEEIEYKIGT